MNKGQISFDFIFALLVAISLISALAVITQDIAEQQKNASITAQAKKISLEVARIVSLKETIEDYDYTLSYYIPKINVPGERIQMDCEINVAGNSVTVTAGSITASTPIQRNGLSNPLTFNCGNKMELNK
ncbi:MAG: hypothetical protein JW703_03525 [Candidatus Diapherotrites archaeon]|nr:hypothetical protein [Candidatus Diapherotrites archaeon]